MDETIYVILKLLFDFALEVWFSIVTSIVIQISCKIILVYFYFFLSFIYLKGYGIIDQCYHYYILF